MPIRALAAICLLLVALLSPAMAAPPLLLISVDGLRPGDVLGTSRGDMRLPTLTTLVRDGTFATGVRGVFPTLTYPSHTTLLTGVSPERHGIINNWIFTPQQDRSAPWFFYARDIRTPTLWDAVREAGLRTANVSWPVSVGAASIDFNLPAMFWRDTAEHRQAYRALATPALLDELEQTLGPYPELDPGPYVTDPTGIERDERLALFAGRLFELKRPHFVTAYYGALDHTEHLQGVDSPEARAVLERIDASIGRLIRTARTADPTTIICLVSDHGFARIARNMNLARAFQDEGLLRIDASGALAGWDAAPWNAAGSAIVMLRDPSDRGIRARVEALLHRLQSDSANGIATIAPPPAIPGAAFTVFFRLGTMMALDISEPLNGPAPLVRATHGFDPALPEMHATFVIQGPGIPQGTSLGEIDMRDIAPTLANLLGVTLDGVEGRNRF